MLGVRHLHAIGSLSGSLYPSMSVYVPIFMTQKTKLPGTK